MLLLCFFLPAFVPWYFWGESVVNAIFVSSLLRYALNLNITWLVNSAAHLYGSRPYDRYINPRENYLVVLGTLGT